MHTYIYIIYYLADDHAVLGGSERRRLDVAGQAFLVWL